MWKAILWFGSCNTQHVSQGIYNGTYLCQVTWRIACWSKQCPSWAAFVGFVSDIFDMNTSLDILCNGRNEKLQICFLHLYDSPIAHVSSRTKQFKAKLWKVTLLTSQHTKKWLWLPDIYCKKYGYNASYISVILVPIHIIQFITLYYITMLSC